MNKKKIIAIYVRVSTKEQNLDNQINQLKEYSNRMNFDIFRVYEDKISGAKENRPGFNKMLEDSRKKLFDAVLCWKLDRIGRSLKHLVSLLEEWNQKGIDIISYNQNIDSTTSSGKLMFHMIGAFAEFERELISERTLAGLDRAKKQGKKLGRPKVSNYHINKVLELYKQYGSINKVSKNINLSYGKVYEIITKGGVSKTPLKASNPAIS